MIDYPARITEWVNAILTEQRAALDAACWHALAAGYTIHVQRNPPSRYIGIEFDPGPTLVVEHPVNSPRWP